MVNRIASDSEIDTFLTNAGAGDVRQSGTVEALSAAASNNSGASTAPAKAPAAPGKTKDVFTGLCEALNAQQQRLADPKDPNRRYDIADEYVIEFAPPSMGASTLKRQGTTDKSNVPMQKPATDSASPSSNSVNYKGVVQAVTAGTQIVQFIDQIMRQSSYITDQQKYIVDPVTQKTLPNPNPPTGVTAWYKISVSATDLGYDNRRRDHAYRMTYVISPYAVNALPSDWFNPARYRGSHKSYNYWFTGLNTEILNFEQEYNFLYRLVISGQAIPPQRGSYRTDFRDQYRRTYLPTSENHAKGADGYTNEAGDNAASYFYSPKDQTEVKLRIVGDPAWMQQGEVSEGINVTNFNFAPFTDDGTINYDSQEVVFDISWNPPDDYNFNTGIVEVNNTGVKPGGKPRTQPQNNFTYTAITVKSYFKQGRFEQDIEGKLLTEIEKNATSSDAGRSVAGSPSPGNGTRAGLTPEDISNGWVERNGLLVQSTDPVANTEPNQEEGAPQLLNSPPPSPPTSDGDITPIITPEENNSVQAGIIDNPDAQLRNRDT